MPEELEARFKKSSKEVMKLSKRPSPPALLKLYSLYKQATQGNRTGKRPGLTNPVARAKYDAWQALAGATPENAMLWYAEYAESLIEADKHGGQ